MGCGSQFQSLIWVACPTGSQLSWPSPTPAGVSIPHMGCMPYGQACLAGSWRRRWCFNPSYGLHALRAQETARWDKNEASFNPSYGLHALRAGIRRRQSRDSPGFNPSYGLHALRATNSLYQRNLIKEFQSLIWVACPTGWPGSCRQPTAGRVSIPHMGCMPYGLNEWSGYIAATPVSIPHMGCMPYGRHGGANDQSYFAVSIPHMGCMPYGQHAKGDAKCDTRVSIPHMGCMPYGHRRYRPAGARTQPFQSLIWVACPTGFASPWGGSRSPPVSIPHMGCMPYGPSSPTTPMMPRIVSIPHMGCMPYGHHNNHLALGS